MSSPHQDDLEEQPPAAVRLTHGTVRFGTPGPVTLCAPVEVTTRVRAVLDLLPRPRVVAVYVDVRRGAVTDAERQLGTRLFEDSVAVSLNDLLVAEQAAASSWMPRWWEVEWALRAVEVSRAVGDGLDGPATTGLAATTASARLAAAATLADLIPPMARRAGGNPLRVPVMEIQAALLPGPGAAGGLLSQLKEEWGLPDEDLPDPDDIDSTSLHAELRRRPVLVFAGADADAAEQRVDIDLGDLVETGLVLPGATATARPVGDDEVPGWQLRIPLHPEVGWALRNLRSVWRAARRSTPPPAAESLLLIAYARLAVLVDLPYSYDALYRTTKAPLSPEPHLVDVLCEIVEDGRSASLAFAERDPESADDAPGLVVTVPLRAAPGRHNTEVRVIPGRGSPLAGRGADPVRDLLELRALQREPSWTPEVRRRVNDLYKRLSSQLEGPEAEHLAAEHLAAERRPTAKLREVTSATDRTVAETRRVESRLMKTITLLIGGRSTSPASIDVDQLRIALASLWKVRVFLGGTPGD